MKVRERCSPWWCWRKSVGHIEISGAGMVEKIPYCNRHAIFAKEVLEKSYPTGEVEVKGTKE